MRVDIQPADTWEAINQVYKDALALGDFEAQAYLGVRHALWEIGVGLSQFISNKKTIVYLKDARPVFESVAIALSREGYTLKALSAEEMNNPSVWLEPLLKDLLLTMTLADDPLTGETFDFPVLDAALKDKRVYRLVVSHSRHRCEGPQKPSLYEARVLSLRNDRAVAVLGERVKIRPPVASGYAWPALEPREAAKELAALDPAIYAKLRTRVEAFESALPAGAERVVPQGRARLYDRTLFAFRDVDGLALVTELAKDLNLSLFMPGEPGALETASLCRWNDERVIAGLAARGLAPEALRGLVILSSEILSPEIPRIVAAARARILALQNP